VLVLALVLTGSRSAAVGLVAGLCALICLAASKVARRTALLVTLLLALVGAVYLQGNREHSLRVRLNYEWPYALTLFFNKPVAGNGDGSYALLAGQFARDDQLEDPRTISFDERSWFGRPDNEYLELLAEVGVVGCLAFVVALALTIHRAVRFCDQTRGDPDAFSRRWLAISLGAALVAIAVEEGGSPALREPGLPAIFLTVWAALWALVRGQQAPVEPIAEERQLGNAVLRLSGVAAGICAVILGYLGVQNWRGALAYLDAERKIDAQNYSAGIQLADFAGENRLDTFQKLLARQRSVLAGALKFDQALKATQQPPTEQDLIIANDALIRLNRLEMAAPRFLSASRLRADLWWNKAQAYHRRGQSDQERESLRQTVQALKQHRADEPFNVQSVQRLWDVFRLVLMNWERMGGRPEELGDLVKDAQTVQRLDWLRALLRYGEAPPGFTTLLMELRGPPQEFDGVMQYRLAQGMQSLEVSPSKWPDALAPETFRLAAISTSLRGFPSDATQLAQTATRLYEKAGQRLFAAHAAALDEWTRFDFDAAPMAHTQENLKRLARAEAILGNVPAVSEDRPLPEALGQTRLGVLLAAGREKEAQEQLDFLVSRLPPPAPSSDPLSSSPATGRPSPRDQMLGEACFAVASSFASQPASADDALRWANRAVQLTPALPDLQSLVLNLSLQRGDHARALEAATALLAAVPAAYRQGVFADLSETEMRYLTSPMWRELRRQVPDFPPPPMVGPPEPQSSSEPAERTESRPTNSTTAPTTGRSD
jgi:hypothetical protein